MLTNQDYDVTLEDEARSRGYSAVFLQPKCRDQGLASHLIELKYLKKADGNQGNIDRAVAEACKQLQAMAKEPPQNGRGLHRA